MRAPRNRIGTRRGAAGRLGMASALACAALVVGTPGPAAAGRVGSPTVTAIDTSDAVPAGFSSWTELGAVQDELNAAAEQLVTAAADRDGFAGVTVPTRSREVRLYWKGPVPADISRLAARLTAAGTRVHALPAPWSRAELVVRQAQMLRADRADRSVTVRSIGALADGSGVEVGLAGTPADVASFVRLQTGGPRTVVLATEPVAFDSWHDTAPWWGGARISIGCTTGFPARRLSDGHPFLITAAHCVSNGSPVFTYGGTFVGNATGDNNVYDTALIDVTTAGERIFAGAGTPTTLSRSVTGDAGNFVGNLVCSAGSYSGERCGIEVKATGVTINTDVGLIFDVVRAEKTDHTSAGGNGDSGDSGGPIYQTLDRTTAKGAGTLTAGDGTTAVPCTGVPASATRQCSWRIFYAPLRAALTRHGLVLNGK